MFDTLESSWEGSARRGRATLASFSIQALSLGLAIAISVLWVERLPQVHWLQISAPATFAPTEPAPTPAVHRHFTGDTAGNLHRGQVMSPRTIPQHAAVIDDSTLGPPAPSLSDIDFRSGRGSGNAFPDGLGGNLSVAIPARPAPAKPLRVSDIGEGSLVHRVQPVYPPLAREARVQGTVELRAIVSKQGTIENLMVVSGSPLLVRSAIEAVRQWRYRPYLLNREPIEVETEITVNFLLSGN